MTDAMNDKQLSIDLANIVKEHVERIGKPERKSPLPSRTWEQSGLVYPLDSRYVYVPNPQAKTVSERWMLAEANHPEAQRFYDQHLRNFSAVLYGGVIHSFNQWLQREIQDWRIANALEGLWSA